MRIYRPHEVPRLGELLREDGWLSYAQVWHVVEAQRETGERFGEVAVRLGYITEHDLRHALHKQWRLRVIAAVVASSLAIASPIAGIAGSTATLTLTGYVRPTATLQVEKGHVVVPIDGTGNASEIEIIEKASGGYDVEIHSQAAEESGGSASFRDASGTSSVPYEVHYGGKSVGFSQNGRAEISAHQTGTPSDGRANTLSIVSRPSADHLGQIGQDALLKDNLTLTIRAH